MGLVLVEFDKDRRKLDDERGKKFKRFQEWLSGQQDLPGLKSPSSEIERVHPPLRNYPEHEERGMHTPKYNLAIEVEGTTRDETIQRVVALCKRIEDSKLFCHAEGFA